MAPGNTVTAGYEKFKEQVERNNARRPGPRVMRLPRKCRPEAHPGNPDAISCL